MEDNELFNRYKNEPCAACGRKTTFHCVLFGNMENMFLDGGEKEPEKQKVVKICRECVESRWIANYRR
jgi:hypothetical protein